MGPPLMGAENYAHSIAPKPEREPDDFYPTPPEATKSLLALERFPQWIWEPACGDGALSRVLLEAGHNVVSTDLVDRGYGEPRRDFLMEHQLLAPAIVTNPPFKLAEEFVERACALGASKIALLLRLAWLEGTTRKELFERTRLSRVHVSSRRLTFGRGGTDFGKGNGGMIAFAWFVWDRTATAERAEIGFFDWMDHAPEYAKQKERPPAEPMPLFD